MSIRPFHYDLTSSSAAAAASCHLEPLPIAAKAQDITDVSMRSSHRSLRDQSGFLMAARNGRVDLLRPALAARLLPISLLNDALIAAASYGQLDAVAFLVTYPQIKQSSLRSAFMIALDVCHGTMAKVILPHIKGQFPRIEDSILITAEKGWGDLLSDLLGRGLILQTARDAAFRLATDSSIREILMSARVITSSTHRKAAASADSDSAVVTLKLQELKADPDLWLYYVSKSGVPSSVFFLEYPETVDFSSVSKQLITTLFQGLIDEKVFSRTEIGLLTADREEQLVRLRHLGRFYSHLDRRNSSCQEPVLTGEFCHPRTFEFCTIAISKRSKIHRLKEGAQLLASIDPTQTLVAKVILDPSIANCQEYQAVALCRMEEVLPHAQAVVLGHLKAAYAIFEGAVGVFRTKMKANPIQTLLALQGEAVSISCLMAALTCEQEGEPLQIKYRWLQEKILSSDSAFRKKFIMKATGKTTLSSADKIHIRQSQSDQSLFEFHKSLHAIDITPLDIAQEIFLHALEASLDESFSTT